jgi:hypothetical protein
MCPKIYASDPIKLKGFSTDEPDFQYEEVEMPALDTRFVIPGKLRAPWRIAIPLSNASPPPPGKYPCLVKVYYGKGRVSQVLFKIIVPKMPG